MSAHLLYIVRVGERFGRLLVLGRGRDKIVGKKKHRFATQTCRCDCGVVKDVLTASLRTGKSTSCGCYRAELLRVQSPCRLPGSKNPNWKGGRRVDKRGYVEVWIPNEHLFFAMARNRTGAGGYVFEHRLVMATYLGRVLADYEEVHHIDNRDRANNQIDNLQLRIAPHGSGGVFRCVDCGSHNIVGVPLAPEPKRNTRRKLSPDECAALRAGVFGG